MLQQSATHEKIERSFARPKRMELLFHAPKTIKLLKDLLVDKRIPLYRKLLFLGSIGALLVVLFFPDLLGESFLSVVLPFIGTILGIPLDAGFDWVAFAIVAVTLLRYFPAEILSEHYRAIFEDA